MLCCERHHSFRQALLLVLLLVAARAIGQRWRGAGGGLHLAGPAALLGAACIGLWFRLPGMITDISVAQEDARITATNWAEARLHAPEMTFRLPVHGDVLEGLAWAPGRYSDGPSAPWYAAAMLRYFGKSSAKIVGKSPPGQ